MIFPFVWKDHYGLQPALAQAVHDSYFASTNIPPTSHGHHNHIHVWMVTTGVDSWELKS